MDDFEFHFFDKRLAIEDKQKSSVVSSMNLTCAKSHLMD